MAESEEKEEKMANANQEGSNKNRIPFYKLFSYADFTDQILMFIGTIGSMASGVCELLLIVLLGELIDAFGHNQDRNNVVPAVSKVSMKFAYTALGMGAASFFQVACWMVTGERQAARIRNLYLKSILRQDISFFDMETNTGEVNARMSGDTVVLQDAMGEKVGRFIKLVAIFVAGFVIAVLRGWHLALVMVSTLPPVMISLAISFLCMARTASRAQSAYSRAANVVEQTISSIKMVASFTGENKAMVSHKKSLDNAYKFEVYQNLAKGLGFGSTMFILFSSFALAFWYGGRLILEKGYTGGKVINVTLAIIFGSMSLGQASTCMTAFAAGQAAMFKMSEVINRSPTIDANEINGKVLDNIRGEIELRDVCFSYPTRPKDRILDGFSISVPSGKTLALVGHSGGGKSTVISLIERFYDPQSGEILIDGINLNEFNLKWIRRQIGLVSQEPVLFTTTIKENIAYGKDSATMEEIKAAAEFANALEFINDLPQGLDTMVGERGTQLSGGQKQRIAIARAILKEPRILLLDEATSALDAQSERTVQEALEKIMVNRTTVVVAHRLTTVRNADTIAVVHQGQIAEKGTHSQLLKDPVGAYSRLLYMQGANKAEAPRRVDNMVTESNIELENRNTSSISLDVPETFFSLGNGIESDKVSEKARDVSIWRLASLGKPELPVITAAATFALITGAIFPIFGLFISDMIQTFYMPPNKLKKDSAFWALMFVVLGAVSFLSCLVMYYLFGIARAKLINRITSMCFEKVVQTEIGWFDEPENSSGVIAAKLSADAATIRILVSDAIVQMLENLVSCIIGLVIAFRASWQLSLFSFAMFPLVGATIYVEQKHTEGFTKDAKMLYEDATQVAYDAVGNMRTVASFCAEEMVMELYNTKCDKPKKRGIKRGLITGMSFGVTCTFIFVLHASLSYFGAWLVSNGKATFADYFRVFYAMYFTTSIISQSSSFTQDFRKAKTVASSIFGLLDRQPKMDLSNASGSKLDSMQGEIEFQNVCYTYPTRPDVKVLRNFSLNVHSGKTVALVGKSGCGKSTVIALLQRFYDPDSGRVMLDGIDTKNFNLKWLRQQMGLVSQEPVLFNETIRANITYGKEDATEAEIIAAAELANAHNFISGLQQGYDTIVGERGVQLSGGQKQRVAIARAIMKNPRILLLDEATSALDAESEKTVQDALDKIMVDRTTIMIAHRLSTVRGADVIAVVKDGAIAEKGNHEMLLAKRDGHYASLVALHTSPSSESSSSDVCNL